MCVRVRREGVVRGDTRLARAEFWGTVLVLFFFLFLFYFLCKRPSFPFFAGRGMRKTSAPTHSLTPPPTSRFCEEKGGGERSVGLLFPSLLF